MIGWAPVLTIARTELRRFVRRLVAPRRVQHALLIGLVRRNTATRFGRMHEFSGIGDIDDFRRRVPIRPAEEFGPFIGKIAAGDDAILTRDPVVAFEETGGTRSGRKLVPYTPASFAAFRRAVLPWLADLAQRRPAAFAGTAYVAVSPANRPPRRLASNIPVGLPSEGAYLGDDVARSLSPLLVAPASLSPIGDISGWRFATLRALVMAETLSFVSVWSPTFLTALLDAMISENEALMRLLRDGAPGTEPAPEASARFAAAMRGGSLNTRVLWPRLDTISAWADGPSRRFAQSLAARFPDVFLEPKGLLATEAAVTLPMGSSGGAIPAIASTFIEFIDQGGSSHLVDELAAGEVYRVVITTAGGLYRYDLGDLVRCIGGERGLPRLVFLGRSGWVTDLVGEKLTEAFVAEVLMGLPVPGLLVACSGPVPHYEFIVETQPDTANVAGRVDTLLCRNPQYGDARAFGQLGPVTMRVARDAIGRHSRAEAGRRPLGAIKPPILVYERDAPWLLPNGCGGSG